MTDYQQGTLTEIRGNLSCQRAVVFLHGFSGDKNDTWDRLPRGCRQSWAPLLPIGISIHWVTQQHFSHRNVWAGLLEAVMDDPDYEWLMIDASYIKAHPHSAGARGGNQAIARTKGGSTASCTWRWTPTECR